MRVDAECLGIRHADRKANLLLDELSFNLVIEQLKRSSAPVARNDEKIDQLRGRFVFAVLLQCLADDRDLADFAIDIAAADPAAEAASILRFAEGDTLCYRADPDEPLYARQQALWEPLLKAAEARHGVRFERVSGIIHRPQPPETLRTLGELLAAQDPFTLAALKTLASLAASLIIALAALEDGADPQALWAAANAEEDWQAEQWGWEWTAGERRAKRLAEFSAAMRFARLVQSPG